jgi:hypothetical protein
MPELKTSSLCIYVLFFAETELIKTHKRSNSCSQLRRTQVTAMLTLLFDQAATHFGQDYHQEQPARLINTEAYLLDKHPDWVWTKPRLPAKRRFCGRIAQNIWSDYGNRSISTLILPIIRALRNTPGVPPERPSVQSIWPSAEGKAFALMRPPGHHATSAEPMGFCYLNSIAIAAHYALAIGCERVAIWDFDAHHGNGTEEIVLGNRRIRFALARFGADRNWLC